MGRSQVQYNRTHGRPGQRGGRARPTTQQTPARPLESNDWRYNAGTAGSSLPTLEQQSKNRQRVLDEKVLALEAHGMYTTHKSGYSSGNTTTNEGDYYGMENENGDDTERFHLTLNVKQMSTALNGTSWSGLMGLPEHLTAQLEVESPRRVARATKKEEEEKQDHVEMTPSDTRTNGLEDHKADTENEEAEEGDLDAWLDDMIS